MAIGFVLMRSAYVDMLLDGRVKINGFGRKVEPSSYTQEQGNQGQLVSANAFELLWKQEGVGCQNNASDRQNNGGRWFTCMGIVQRTWTRYVRENPSLNLPARVEVAYKQLGSSEFKKHAIEIYKNHYCQPINCNQYKGPMPALLMAISANGGPGVAKRHLANTENIKDPVERAKKIAELEEQRYYRIARNNPSQRKFLRGGWGNNIREREKFIERFRNSEKSV